MALLIEENLGRLAGELRIDLALMVVKVVVAADCTIALESITLSTITRFYAKVKPSKQDYLEPHLVRIEVEL